MPPLYLVKNSATSVSTAWDLRVQRLNLAYRTISNFYREAEQMNKWILFNKKVHVLNILSVTNGYVQVLGSDGSSFNSPNGDYDCFYIHHCNSCCLAGLFDPWCSSRLWKRLFLFPRQISWESIPLKFNTHWRNKAVPLLSNDRRAKYWKFSGHQKVDNEILVLLNLTGML